jgi:hypothetical protein
MVRTDPGALSGITVARIDRRGNPLPDVQPAGQVAQGLGELSTRPQTRRAARSAPAPGARIEAEHMGNSSRRERNGVSNTQGVAGNFRH